LGQWDRNGHREKTIHPKIASYLTGVNKIISVFGIRRGGKSYILRQVSKNARAWSIIFFQRLRLRILINQRHALLDAFE